MEILIGLLIIAIGSFCQSSSYVPIKKVKEFQVEYVDFLKNKHPEVMAALKSGKIDDQLTGVLKQVATELSAKYN